MAQLNNSSVTAETIASLLSLFRKVTCDSASSVSSAALAEALQIDPATIRRDFSYLGELGKKGYGYNVIIYSNFCVTF